MKKKYFVTGGAGFIGSHTVDALVARGDEVTVFDIVPEKEACNLAHQKDAITYIEGDVRSIDDLKTMQGHTHILHLAAIVSVPHSIEHPIETHSTNVTGTVNVLESAKTYAVEKVVLASSAAVYGDAGSVVVDEELACKPLSPYGLHKQISEQYAGLYQQQFGVSTIGLRYFNVFGTRQDPTSPYSGVISIFADRLKREESVVIYGDGSATRDFVHVENVVNANLLALGSDTCGVYNVGTGVETSMIDLYESMRACGFAHTEPQFVSARTGDIMHSVANIEKITTELDYKVEKSLASGLETLF